MTLYNVMKLAHVLAAVLFAGGLFARQIVRSFGARTDDVLRFAHLTQAASRLEHVMVRPGSIILLVLGLVQARLGGIPIFGVLSGGDQNWLLASMALYVAAFALIPL